MARPFRYLPFAVSLAALAACAPPGPYPSLAVRPAEKAYQAGEEERQPAPRTDNPGVAERIAQLRSEAGSGDAAFGAALPAARASAGRAGSPGSDSWVEAQQALSRLEAARARTTRALADLDAYALAQTNSGTLSASDAEQLRAAVVEVQALADAQAERLDQLQATLKPR